jgi:hypothetical protein
MSEFVDYDAASEGGTDSDCNGMWEDTASESDDQEALLTEVGTLEDLPTSPTLCRHPPRRRRRRTLRRPRRRREQPGSCA